jgi:recombination protein RecA
MAGKRNHAADIAAAIGGAFKGASVKRLSEGQGLVGVIPTGIDVLDRWILGCGGLPRGKLVEVFASFDVGKTSLAFTFLAAAQRAGGIGLLFETENTLQPDRAAVFGVELGDVMLSENASTQELAAQTRIGLQKIPKGVGPNVLVWDSLAASQLDEQIEGAGASVMGKKARVMSEELPVLARLARDSDTTIVIINQERTKLGVVFGDPTTTPGGSATKFQASVRLQMWRGKAFEDGGFASGHRVTIKAVKNKFALPSKKAVLRLDYRTGWNNEWSLYDLAKTLKAIPEGARVSADNTKKALSGLAEQPDWYVE